MITKINDIDLRTLSQFTKGYNKNYHIRELQRILKVSSKTSLTTLAKLEKRNILKSEIKGKLKIYSINNSKISREFFYLVER